MIIEQKIKIQKIMLNKGYFGLIAKKENNNLNYSKIKNKIWKKKKTNLNEEIQIFDLK
jgi:hypothetical protein